MGEVWARVKAKHRLGTLALDVDFSVSGPWTVLFGPSGSGKSTVLRIVAGLLRPRTASLILQGRAVADTSSGLWVASHRRAVRWAGQRAALFPQKDVFRNLLLGLGANPFSSAGPLRGEVERALDVFGLRELAHAMPRELSGGQRQKVSVVRAAIGARGGLLLLDEPFAGLDAPVRDGLIAGLRDWLPETGIVSVTHDVGEAFLLGADVVRMEAGRVVAHGPPGLVLAEERERLRAMLG